ncbi:MAG: hypothetical protein ACFFAE_08940 [Candidatus Hodarchaeota archaeon]
MTFGTDLFYKDSQDINQSLPRILEPGEKAEQIFAIGRGQTLILEAQSNSSLILRVISGYSVKAYQKNPKPESSLYFHEGSIFFFKITFVNYSIVYIYWDNSQSINITMIETASLYITGLDLDLITTGSIFLIIGILYEVFARFTVNLLKKKSSRFLDSHQNNISLPGIITSKTKTEKTIPSKSRMVLLVLGKEWSIFSSGILFGVLLVSFLVVNPSEKLLLLEPSSRTLTISMIAVWFNIYQFFGVFWAIVIGLVGSGIWKAKQDTKELRNDLSLPLNKRVYAFAVSILLGLSCSFCTSIPFLAAILINYLRFIQVPKYSILVIPLSIILTWQIALILGSSTICLQFPRLSLFSIILLLLSVIFITIVVTDWIVPSTLLLPLPNKLEILLDLILTNGLEFKDLFSLIGGGIALVSGIFFLYITTIERVQIE